MSSDYHKQIKDVDFVIKTFDNIDRYDKFFIESIVIQDGRKTVTLQQIKEY